jgi:pimeloyl-ACP methyl ester carboxylesterase
MTKHLNLHRVALVAVLALSGCAQYATVKKTRPRFRPVRSTIAAIVSVEQRIANGLRYERREPEAAIGNFLIAAQLAVKHLEADPSDTVARDAYNFAVGRVIDIIGASGLAPWTRPLRIPAEGGDFILTHRRDPRKGWNPALYDFTPADCYDVKGRYVSDRERKEGVGAPLVAVGREKNEHYEENFTIPRSIYGVTGIIRFEGKKAEIAFLDPLATEDVSLGGRRFPMAADYTVPLAVMLASTDPKQLELSRLLRPGEYEHTTLLARLQPYDPDKTVVLVVHGLMDSPATWTPMINQLRADERIRSKYQFWFFSYPSGYAYPHSAALLRHELDAIAKKFPTRKKMVVIGHSMGGCISRLLITDTGEKLWMKVFKSPPDQVPMPPDSKKLIAEAIIFRHRPEIGRVIFVSAPLRGSEIASNWVGRIGSSLVRSPATLVKAGSDALKVTQFDADDLKIKRIPDSVDTLAPNNRFVKAINTIPVTPGIPHHVICGDRGKGGNKDKTKPVMSDGVVPYWSSHMPEAESELIVPSGHPAHQNPEAIAEVKRILLFHGGQPQY